MSNIIKSGQVTIPASSVVPTKLIGVNNARRRLYIQVPAGSSVYIGDNGVNASNGFLYGSTSTTPLPPLELNCATEVWMYPSSASALTVSFFEESA